MYDRVVCRYRSLETRTRAMTRMKQPRDRPRTPSGVDTDQNATPKARHRKIKGLTYVEVERIRRWDQFRHHGPKETSLCSDVPPRPLPRDEASIEVGQSASPAPQYLFRAFATLVQYFDGGRYCTLDRFCWAAICRRFDRVKTSQLWKHYTHLLGEE